MKVLETTIYALIEWIISNPESSEEEAVAYVLSLESTWEVQDVSGFLDALATELIKVQWVVDPSWDAIRDKVVQSGEQADKTLTDLLIKSKVLEPYSGVQAMICKSQLVEQEDHLEQTNLSIDALSSQIETGEDQVGVEEDEDIKAVLEAGLTSLKSELSRLQSEKAVIEGIISSLNC